jgi:ubiquinone biosynthesis protein UbiJ
MTDPAPNAWLPAPLRKLAGRALETALNHTLSLDPDTRHALTALDGRRVVLQLRGPELALAVTVTGERLRVGPPDADDAGPALRVAATPGSLLAMALRRGDDGVAPGQVEIAGDADLARRLQKLAERFAPDFEEAFARTFGDVLGVPIARAVRQALAHAKESVSRLGEDAAAWLRDEARLAIAPGEAEAFLDGVDALREKSERLEARLARLEARLKGRAA